MKMTFQDLAKRILARPCVHPVRLVAVDGGAGAGKTTFAGRLAASLGGVPVIPMDDFISFDDLTEFWSRLEGQVLTPLFQGRDVRYQKRDWVNDLHGSGLGDWREVPFFETVVLEGVGASRQALASRLTYAVWVDAPSEVRLQRGLERDAGIEGIRAIWEQWMIGEERFLDADGARGRADMVVDGTMRCETHEFVILTLPERDM